MARRLTDRNARGQAAHASRCAAARRVGCTAEEYERHVDAGESWCSACRAWLTGDAFHGHQSRPTGAQAYCAACRVGMQKAYRARKRAA